MRRDVALFITCLADQFYPRVGIAVTRVLEHFGCTVHFPADQTCCGQPLFNNGHTDAAAALARRMVEIFEPWQNIVTPSASCCAMVREQFPRLLGSDPAWATATRRLCSRTFEFVEFLTRVLRVDLRGLCLPRPTTLTVHYNCHQRPLGLRDESRQLLRQIGNVRLCEMPKAEQCCGFGGAFAVKYPAISGAIAADKLDCIAASGAAFAVSNDAGCTMNIAGAAHRRGMPIRLLHIAEVIAEALGMDVEHW